MTERINYKDKIPSNYVIFMTPCNNGKNTAEFILLNKDTGKAEYNLHIKTDTSIEQNGEYLFNDLLPYKFYRALVEKGIIEDSNR